MIPIRLSLEHFFSYRRAILDLSQIHTACIFGSNGAGKSTLLEAMTWALWGQCRSPREEDVIRQGETEAQVELIYESRQERFRVIRSRRLGGSGSLEWQIQAEVGWRSLTRKTLRATQAAIQTQLGLDYETFINSVYLRQGRADEFTVKRPTDRKRILAEILKLDAYEHLAERSREESRRLRLRIDWVQQHCAQQPDLVARQVTLVAEEQDLRQTLTEQQTQHQQEEEYYRHLQQTQERHHHLQQQRDRLHRLLGESEQQWRQQQQYLDDLRALIQRTSDIEAGARQHQALVTQEHHCHQRLQEHQRWQVALRELGQQLEPFEQERQRRQQEIQQQKNLIQTQLAQDQQVLAEADHVQQAYQNYRRAYQQQQQWEKCHTQALPLLGQMQHWQQQVQLERAHLSARRTLLEQHIQQQQQRAEHSGSLAQVQAAVATVVADLERQRIYHQRLQEKIQERRGLVHQLQERQRTLQRQWHWLQQEQALVQEQPQAPCPLCEQPLSPDLRTRLLQKHSQQTTALQDDLLVIREQLAVADREITLFEQEAATVEATLHQLDQHHQSQGRLQEQQLSYDVQARSMAQWQEELHQIEAALALPPEQHPHWQALHQALAEIGYNDKDHALARSEVERWRWSVGRWQELQKVRSRHTALQRQLVALEQQWQALEAIPPQWQALYRQRDVLTERLRVLAYDPIEHQAIREQLHHSQTWVLQHQALHQAQAQLSQVEQQCHQFHQRWQQHHQEYRHVLSQLPPEPLAPTLVEECRQRVQQRRREIDQTLAALGANQQQQQALQDLLAQHQTLSQELETLRRQQVIYQELTYAFGPNGIPAFVIENVLPELETQANQILSRLTQHQLHVHFHTQRSGRRSGKLIDTLDIVIADARGTRPYETYSGGEAFRINFAIRLALSYVLMQRSGSRLQTLMIDEGFGTQDPTGRQHLIAAINAIAGDFARILVITHIPSLRDAFPQRLQITASDQGSQIQML
ncbi:MAG: SMC family ATPase [Synechococcales cyanobacterium]